MHLTLSNIAKITGGRLVPAGAEAPLRGVATDSRTIAPGQLFVPLRGERYDGHDYLLEAVRRGAAACLSEDEIAGFPVPVVRVADTLTALGDLAAAWRARFGIPVVAVTGSSGKTTTKEMLAGILALRSFGLKSEGNFNNLIGVPLTLVRLLEEHRWAVVEMGMSGRGEIARLAAIAAPDMGMITNVGEAHLETLHGLDGVARAKGELFAALRPGATAIINADDERVRRIPVANGVRRLQFGCTADADVRAEEVSADAEGTGFRLVVPEGRFPVRLPVLGRHNVGNALAAAAAATALGIDGATIVRGLEAFTPGPGRMERVQLDGGVLVLEDTYNANPDSVKAALTALDEAGQAGRRIAVLGDMLELGRTARSLHQEVGLAAARRADHLLLFGEWAAAVAEGARRGGMAPGRIEQFESHERISRRLREMLKPGDRVLIKGSRGMRMEKVCRALRETEAELAVGH